LEHGPVAENPFDRTNFGLLAALSAEPRRNSLLDHVAPPTPKPEVSPMARALADLFRDKPNATLPVSPFNGAANDLFFPAKPASSQLGNLGAVADLFPLANFLPANPYPCSGAISDLFVPFTTTPSNTSSGAAADLFPTAPPSNPFGSLAGVMPSSPSVLASSPPARHFGSLADLLASPPLSSFNALSKPKPVAPETKRKAFFSFHFDDIMRVNNVRNAWKITHPDSSSNRSFYDSSLWETRKLVAQESVKQLIRAGVLSTSAVCVLAGSMTWDRRWVKYEIARAVIEGRGLLTVHLNSINHHQTRGPHPIGPNPLAHMGIAKLQADKRLPPQYYLYELTFVLDGHGDKIEHWSPYHDYTAAVEKPAWLTDPSVDHVMALSVDAAEYDYEQDNGHRNIGSWIDMAANQAGR
jgi:hypothetical protein